MNVNKVMEKSNNTDHKADDGSSEKARHSSLGIRMGSILRTWADISRINYLSGDPLETIKSGQTLRRRSTGIINDSQNYSLHSFLPSQLRIKIDEEAFTTEFPINVTSLMNEDQLWGCFYIFPELYADAYSPVVRIRNLEDVPDLVGGVLTGDMVTACLSYLKRTPILGDFVFIKLDLSSKHLINIEVLQHFKYLVYLDLSCNLLTELTVLSHLVYLQYLSVAFNRLNAVLEYDTQVHYKFNSVKKIRDLSAFWSVTILDLSHNNIKSISGLEKLKYLRRLDLSFNHIQHLENLNHLRLLWLDVSYNNISSFEFGPQTGLWTLLHLEYLNLNENNLTSMKMFTDCTSLAVKLENGWTDLANFGIELFVEVLRRFKRLRELHVRNNRFGSVLELAVYMRQMRRLIVLDLRANPICSTPGYKDVVLNTFPILLCLDSKTLDPVEQRSSRMEMSPDVLIFATRRLLRLLYIEQLSRARVSPFIPPADTAEVPIVVLVGYQAVGKGTLARRLASQCSTNIALAKQHTTASHHFPGHYIEVSRSKFDDMLLAGEFLTYSEVNGESYGLSREEAFVKDGKVKIVTMDLIGALMLTLRGFRPYLILASLLDKNFLHRSQKERKEACNMANVKRRSHDTPLERLTLQVLLSGRIIITGILNEILVTFPEDKEDSEFVIESKCSLFMDSDARQAARDQVNGYDMLTLLTSSTTSLEDVCKRAHDKNSQVDTSLYSLYKESQGTHDEYTSEGHNSYQDPTNTKKSVDPRQSLAQTKQEKLSNLSRRKSVDFSRYASSTFRVADSTKSSKSVTFISQDNEILEVPGHPDLSGLLVEPQKKKQKDDKTGVRSISTKLQKPPHCQRGDPSSSQDDLWLAFLIDTGLLRTSENTMEQKPSDTNTRQAIYDDPNLIIKQLEFYHKVLPETYSTNIRDDYEEIHRIRPGLFWNTVIMDNQEEAFLKVKGIIREIINSQKTLKPMFDIDFANMPHYPIVERRLTSICKRIAPQRLFY